MGKRKAKKKTNVVSVAKTGIGQGQPSRPSGYQSPSKTKSDGNKKTQATTSRRHDIYYLTVPEDDEDHCKRVLELLESVDEEDDSSVPMATDEDDISVVFTQDELDDISEDENDNQDSISPDVIEDEVSASVPIRLIRPKKKKLLRNNKRPTTQGRKRDPIWDEFEKPEAPSDGNTSRLQWKCKLCKSTVSPEAKRLRAHLEKCKSRILERQRQMPNRTHSVNDHDQTSTIQNNSSESESVPAKTNAESVPVSDHIRPPKTPVTKSSILNFVDRTSQVKKELIDIKLAKFIFSKNLAFNIVEDEQFKEYSKEMRPSYTPPSHEVIGGTLLDKVHSEIMEDVKVDLKNKKVVLQQDGWSTTMNHPVIAHSVSSGVKSFFSRARCTGTNPKTAEYCQKLIEEEIQYVESQYQCKVIGIVTDNCNVMKLLRQNLSQKYQDLLVYGCNSHLLNLVGQDFTPSDLKTKIVKVQNYFRNTHYASASLLEKKGLRPVIPGDTRWNSQIDCFESFMKNQAKYLEVSRESTCKMPDDIRQIIEDIHVYEELNQVVKNLKPISMALDKLQSDQSNVGDAAECWARLEQELEDSQSVAFRDRMKQGMTPIAIAANMLHPKYRGKRLSAEHLRKGNEWLASKSPYFVIAASNLNLGDTSFYPKTYLDNIVSSSMNPSNWWSSVQREQLLPLGLVDLATSLMTLPSSTGAIERCFSTLGAIMSKPRSRLDVEKGSKLCYINQYYKARSRGDVYIDRENLN